MQLEVGTIVEGKVTDIKTFGAFVELPERKTGMIHISEVSKDYVKNINDFLTRGQTVKVKVISFNEKGAASLSLKQVPQENIQAKVPELMPKKEFVKPRPQRTFGNRKPKPEPNTFESMMASFKHLSEEKISDLKKGQEAKRRGGARRSK